MPAAASEEDAGRAPSGPPGGRRGWGRTGGPEGCAGSGTASTSSRSPSWTTVVMEVSTGLGPRSGVGGRGRGEPGRRFEDQAVPQERITAVTHRVLEGRGEFAGAGESVAGRLGHRPGEHGVQRSIHVGPEGDGARWWLVLVRPQDPDGIGRRERDPPGQALEEDAAQRVRVGAPVNWPAGRDLGGHVVDGAEDLARAGGIPHAGRDRREVGQEDPPAFTEEDVGRLDIAMDDPGRVRGVEARGESCRQSADLRATASGTVGGEPRPRSPPGT